MPPQPGDMVSTLPPSPARKPGNPSPRSYHGLGRRRREDIRAIRCGGSNCCGPKSTRRKTIELNRSCFYRTGLVAGWIATGACTVSLRDAGRAPPCTLPPKTAMCIFYFVLSSCENFVHWQIRRSNTPWTQGPA